MKLNECVFTLNLIAATAFSNTHFTMPGSTSRPLKQGSYLGFDYGDKHIGVAVGQRLTCTATGLETIPALVKKPMWDAITRLVETWRPQGFVVGLTYQEDGSDNPVNPQIRKFCRQLEGRYHLPVHVMDETLSTVESKSLFYQSRAKRSTGFGAVKDILAAQLILQTWLEHTAQLERQNA
jgi:putative Holliday junction resolvase